MRKLLFVLIIIWVTCGLCTAGTVITNPASPKNPKAGYSVQLKEVLKIYPKNDDFYFLKINRLKLDETGNIFVKDKLDEKSQLLQFRPDGTFVRNFFKMGQGPQEAENLSNFYIDKNKLILQSIHPTKMIVFDIPSGKMLKEFKVGSPADVNDRNLFYADTNYYFWEDEIFSTEGKIVVADSKKHIITVAPDGKIIGKRLTINSKFLRVKDSYINISLPWTNFLTQFIGKDGYVYSNTFDYKITVINTRTLTIEREFSRKYQPVKLTNESKKFLVFFDLLDFEVNNKHYKVKEPEFCPDIQTIMVNGDKLWVVTSTVKDGNKVLIDVFNREGVYLDNFYLPVPRGLNPYNAYKWFQAIDNKGYLYTIEMNEDEECFIKKYEIIVKK